MSDAEADENCERETKKAAQCGRRWRNLPDFHDDVHYERGGGQRGKNHYT